MVKVNNMLTNKHADRQKRYAPDHSITGHKNPANMLLMVMSYQAKSRKYRGIFEEHSPEK